MNNNQLKNRIFMHVSGVRSDKKLLQQSATVQIIKYTFHACNSYDSLSSLQSFSVIFINRLMYDVATIFHRIVSLLTFF